MSSISVVIPSYNSKNTLKLALDSIASQTWPIQETIVVDDGSTDGTAAMVCQSYPGVRVIETANGGPSKARNRGVKEATGDWIAFLDADDEWHPAKTACQMAVLEQHPEVLLVSTDWTRQFPDPLNEPPNPPPTTEISFRSELILNRFQTSTVLMRRSLFLALGGFDPVVDGAEDWDLWLRVSRQGLVVKVDVPLVAYRDVAAGYSKDVLRVYRTMQPMLDKHRDAGLGESDFRRIETWHHWRFLVAFWLLHDRPKVQMAWKNILRLGLFKYTGGAMQKYLLPFLWARARRRLRQS